MKTVLVLILMVSLTSIGQDNKEDEVNTFLDGWHSDAANADIDSYFSKIHPEGIFIGTDESEVWSKEAFHEWSVPKFAEGKTWDFKAYERNIYFSETGEMAWFDEKLSTSTLPLRGSGVLKYWDGKWIIMHYVLSVMVPNEKYYDVVDVLYRE